MPKATTPTSSHKRRHNPLEDDLLATGVLKNKTAKSKRDGDARDNDGEQSYVDAKASRQILAMSRSLIEEDEAENEKKKAASGPSAFDYDPDRFGDDSDPEDAQYVNDNDDAWGDEGEVVEEIEVDAEDLETFNKFITPSMNEDPLFMHGWDRTGGDGQDGEQKSANLADIILAKIAEKESAMQGGREIEVEPVDEDYELPPKLIEVYTKYVVLRGGLLEGSADLE